MKSYKKTSASKLVKRFDNELKAILLSDLKNIGRVKSPLFNNLSAA